MRKWLQPHGGRREDRDGSEMAPSKKRRRRKGERERQKGLEIDRIIGRQMEGRGNRGRENEKFLKEIGFKETEKAHRKG